MRVTLTVAGRMEAFIQGIMEERGISEQEAIRFVLGNAMVGQSTAPPPQSTRPVGEHTGWGSKSTEPPSKSTTEPVEKEGTFKEGDRAGNASASSPLGRVGEVVASASSPSLPSIPPTTVDNSPGRGPVQCPAREFGDPNEDWDHCPDGEDHSLDEEGVCVRCGERVLGATELTPENFARFNPSRATTAARPGLGQEPEAPGSDSAEQSGFGAARRVEAPHFQGDRHGATQDQEARGEVRSDQQAAGARQGGPHEDRGLHVPPNGALPARQDESLTSSPQPAAKSRGSRPSIGPRFEAFWATWPSGPRAHRGPAEKAWQRLERENRLAPVVAADGKLDQDLMIAALERDSREWSPGYEPMPSTWLNQNRFATSLRLLGWEARVEPNRRGWTWHFNAPAAQAPVLMPRELIATPTRPRWAVDYTAARCYGDIGGRLRSLLMAAYPGWPIRPPEDPELSRVEAILSEFDNSRDIDEILSLRPAVEVEIAKLEEALNWNGWRSTHRPAGLAPAQPSLWRDAPS